MEKKRFIFFSNALIFMGIFGFVMIFDFFVNNIIPSVIQQPDSGYYRFLRNWSFVYMGIGTVIVIIFQISQFTSLSQSENPKYHQFTYIMLVANFLYVVSIIYYPILQVNINPTINPSRELFFRMIYYILLGLSISTQLTGWIFFRIGCKNENRNIKVVRSVELLQVENIINLISIIISCAVWIIYLLYPEIGSLMALLIPFYLLFFVYTIVSIIGYISLGKLFSPHRFQKHTQEPLLDYYSSPPRESFEPMYQEPKVHSCPNCGSKLVNKVPFCPFCGCSLQ